MEINKEGKEEKIKIQKKYEINKDEDDVIDRTNIPYPNGISTVAGLHPRITEMHLVHCSLRSISGLETLVNLKKLVLRDNLIEKIENIQHLQKLEELDLYLNQISVIENIHTPSLTFEFLLIFLVKNLAVFLFLLEQISGPFFQQV